MTNQTALNADDHGSLLPMTPTEQVVAPIWAELLQQATVAPNDNFFELGGDSIMMMMVLFRVSDELQVELPPGVLMESPTLTQFCRLIDTTRLTAQAASLSNNDMPQEEGIV